MDPDSRQEASDARRKAEQEALEARRKADLEVTPRIDLSRVVLEDPRQVAYFLSREAYNNLCQREDCGDETTRRELWERAQGIGQGMIEQEMNRRLPPVPPEGFR